MKFKDYLTEATVHPNDRIQLINDLLRETDSNYKMKLTSKHPTAALDETIKIMSRIARGFDSDQILASVAHIASALKNTRKAVLPIPTWAKNLESAGVWIDNAEAGKVLANLQAQQLDIMNSTFFFHDLNELLLALTELWQLYEDGAGHDGRMGTTEAEHAFLKAGFKKLGIIA